MAPPRARRGAGRVAEAAFAAEPAVVAALADAGHPVRVLPPEPDGRLAPAANDGGPAPAVREAALACGDGAIHS